MELIIILFLIFVNAMLLLDRSKIIKDSSKAIKRTLDQQETLNKQLVTFRQDIIKNLIPEGYVVLPEKLTAENGAKGLLMGEFYERIDMDGQEVKVPVSWDNIKLIYSQVADGLQPMRFDENEKC